MVLKHFCKNIYESLTDDVWYLLSYDIGRHSVYQCVGLYSLPGKHTTSHTLTIHKLIFAPPQGYSRDDLLVGLMYEMLEFFIGKDCVSLAWSLIHLNT